MDHERWYFLTTYSTTNWFLQKAWWHGIETFPTGKEVKDGFRTLEHVA